MRLTFRRHSASDDFEQALHGSGTPGAETTELVSLARRLGLSAADIPQPADAVGRAALKSLVVRERASRPPAMPQPMQSRKTGRGAALTVAAVAGAGLLVASAAGGGQTFSTVREAVTGIKPLTLMLLPASAGHHISADTATTAGDTRAMVPDTPLNDKGSGVTKPPASTAGNTAGGNLLRATTNDGAAGTGSAAGGSDFNTSGGPLRPSDNQPPAGGADKGTASTPAARTPMPAAGDPRGSRTSTAPSTSYPSLDATARITPTPTPYVKPVTDVHDALPADPTTKPLPPELAVTPTAIPTSPRTDVRIEPADPTKTPTASDLAGGTDQSTVTPTPSATPTSTPTASPTPSPTPSVRETERRAFDLAPFTVDLSETGGSDGNTTTSVK